MLNTISITNKQNGMTLIELMVAITIGGILLAGIASIFFNSSRTQRELSKSGELIENGRYAINLVGEELRHVGYFGHYYDLDDSTGILPDPCTTNMANLEDNMVQALSGYTAADESTRADITATSCDDLGLLDDANLEPGTDVLVIMRADTATSNASTVQGAVYLQANSQQKTLLTGNGAAPATVYLKYPTKTGFTTPADTRQFHVNTYFVAPCTIGNGANGVCDGTEDYMPTLKRLELSTDGTDPDIVIMPLVEGVEKFLVEYGIDNSPNTANAITGEIGDGVPDLYAAEPTAAEWPNVITARVSILVRAPRPTDEHTDTKKYNIAGLTFGPFNDTYKRHVFTTEVRPVNLAGRREIPK
jgi:type IV pilus assembly protein PilW